MNPRWQAYNKLLIFGGAFDPPHHGHIDLPQQVRQRLGFDVVVYVPSGNPPHRDVAELTPAPHRLAMLQLALRDVERAVILTDEIELARRGIKTYTVDTLKRLRRELSAEAEMRLLIGADQFRTFSSWKQPQRVIDLAEPVVMVRPPDGKAALLDSLADDGARAAWGPRIVEVEMMDVSATEIRRRAAAGQSIADLAPEAVARYVREQGLYED